MSTNVMAPAVAGSAEPASDTRIKPAYARHAVVLWAGAFFVVYTYFALTNHRQLGTGGWDLGIFQQAVAGYAHFRGPISDIRGWNFNLFGDHFHPIIALLAPLYWIHPKATTLLVAQAALLAWSIIPIGRLAERRLPGLGGQAVAVAYGLSWGVQGALNFDFHEIAFAAPLLAYALVAIVEERWRAGLLWTLPLLLVKEEMAVLVAAIGVYLLWRRRWWYGAILVVAGVAMFFLTSFVIIPHFNPAHQNPYIGGYSGAGGGITSRILHLPLLLVDDQEKRATLAQIGLTTGLLALRSPLVLVGLPGLAARFMSPLDSYWTTGFHYNLTLMPIVFVAYLDAYPHLIASRWSFLRGYAKRSAAVLMAIAMMYSQHYPLQNVIWSPLQAWKISPSTQAAYSLMKKIPDGALVETTNHFAPHLSNRCRVIMWPVVDDQWPDWVLDDPTDPFHSTPEELRRHIDDLEISGYHVVAISHGYVLLRRT